MDRLFLNKKRPRKTPGAVGGGPPSNQSPGRGGRNRGSFVGREASDVTCEQGRPWLDSVGRSPPGFSADGSRPVVSRFCSAGVPRRASTRGACARCRFRAPPQGRSVHGLQAPPRPSPPGLLRKGGCRCHWHARILAFGPGTAVAPGPRLAAGLRLGPLLAAVLRPGTGSVVGLGLASLPPAAGGSPRRRLRLGLAWPPPAAGDSSRCRL